MTEAKQELQDFTRVENAVAVIASRKARITAQVHMNLMNHGMSEANANTVAPLLVHMAEGAVYVREEDNEVRAKSRFVNKIAAFLQALGYALQRYR